MTKINFFYNFELFKRHLNFTGSAEQPKRLDIIKLAKEKGAFAFGVCKNDKGFLLCSKKGLCKFLSSS